MHDPNSPTGGHYDLLHIMVKSAAPAGDEQALCRGDHLGRVAHMYPAGRLPCVSRPPPGELGEYEHARATGEAGQDECNKRR
jgi:hypothetical protein